MFETTPKRNPMAQMQDFTPGSWVQCGVCGKFPILSILKHFKNNQDCKNHAKSITRKVGDSRKKSLFLDKRVLIILLFLIFVNC